MSRFSGVFMRTDGRRSEINRRYLGTTKHLKTLTKFRLCFQRYILSASLHSCTTSLNYRDIGATHHTIKVHTNARLLAKSTRKDKQPWLLMGWMTSHLLYRLIDIGIKVDVWPYEVCSSYVECFDRLDRYFSNNLRPQIIGFSLKDSLTWGRDHLKYEGWNFNSGNYLFTIDTK